MAHFQTPTPVKIDQLDLGQIQKDNALSALYDQRLQGMAYDNQSRNALNDVLKVNPNATSGEVQNALAQAGYGASAPDITAKMGNNALLQAKIAKAQTDFISTFAPMVKDQSSLDMVRTKFMSTFGQDIPTQFHTYYDGIGQDALKLSLGAAQNIQLQRNDATGAAVGAPAGVDVGLWNNVDMARKADARAAAAADRAAGLYPGQLEQQGATLEHTRASTEALNTKTDIPKIQWAKDMGGMETTPYALGKDGTWTQMPVNKPNTMTPPPAGEDGNASYSGGAGKKLDAATAKAYLQKAGGDVKKAREMARAEGWSF